MQRLRDFLVGLALDDQPHGLRLLGVGVGMADEAQRSSESN